MSAFIMTLAILGALPALAQAELSPVAEWPFAEGSGVETADSSGGLVARMHGAAWISTDAGYALRFDGVDDYLECGDGPAAHLSGSITLEAWVHPEQPAQGEPGIFGTWFEGYALTFYRGACWFYIGSGANKVNAPLPVGQWSHVVATFDGDSLRLYINGQKPVVNKSTFDTIPPAGPIRVGAISPSGSATPTSFFAGMVASPRIYDRALDWKIVAVRYNADARHFGQAPVDAGRFDRLQLQLFPYPERGELIARIDATNVTLPRNEIRIEVHTGGAAIQALLPEDGDRLDVALPAPAPDVDSVTCTVVLFQGEREISRTEETAPWAAKPATVPDSTTYRVPSLPAPVVAPPYQYALDDAGAIALDVDGERFEVTSRFVCPQGGFNTLGTTAGNEWVLRKDGDDAVVGRGAYYTIRRELRRTATRIEVVDEITNTSDGDVGIMLEHHLAGPEGGAPTLNPNPTVFLAGPKHGVGLVALDDVFFLRAENRVVDGRAVLADRHLALPPDGTHTVRWAIYPTATTDYYDFINQVRADEGINGYVPGCFAFTSSWEVPPAEYMAHRNLAFYSWASLTRVLQNPVNSLEGWEFTDYPELCDTIRAWIGATRAAYPNLQTTFHVAHSLFANNTPEALFPDSVARDVDGNLICYGGNNVDYYSQYFAPELVAAGWRWWIYYPTMENTFGKRMMAAADYMITDLGATSVWADGYISGYVPGDFTYDHWDGVSATMDPDSHAIVAKKALVPYVALPVLKAVARKYTDAGGYLITNGKPGPFSFTRLPVISSCETSGGDQQPIAQLHLGSTVTPLGAPSAIKTFQDVYDDILRKLDYGALYFWYGEGDTVTEPTIVSEMYPITFESIHPGTVRGKERIVTKVSGVYGWPDDHHLHQVHFYDGRGRKRPHAFVTTVDEAGVRTEVTLRAGESAVIEKLSTEWDGAEARNMCIQAEKSDG